MSFPPGEMEGRKVLKVMEMNKLRFTILLALLAAGTLAHAQTFDGKKTYELYAAEDLVLDNQCRDAGKSRRYLLRGQSGRGS